MVKQFKTIIVSGIHLGFKKGRTKNLMELLEQYKTKNLIFIGETFDDPFSSTMISAEKKQMKAFNKILKIVRKNDTDTTLVKSTPFEYLPSYLHDNESKYFKVQNELVYTSGPRKYYIKSEKSLSIFHQPYSFLLNLGQLGKKLANWIFVRKNNPNKNPQPEQEEKNREIILKQASKAACDGIIIASPHMEKIETYKDTPYMNCGSWYSSQCALVEDMDGDWSLLYYNDSNSTQNMKIVDLWGMPNVSKTKSKLSFIA
ncbi:hypothetical protein [Aureibacter tunicatorum]|uniref:UDP-2,3-diacylglucosamine pyrophosphatase LpxH n=1 Tax=Aureibacter tunicatorum TaxID=866807 RepID=A0AAE3XJ12_9BACT|nr:hypothetical protein [Aureibacter tunicatorum]MDR6237752.1 UDP-2,3-diacylglucosamine pyrophosphatase LpxH [Aureibacter tunicatorum]BDD02787.1 UDP-2,3-diacylglucosamine hydrolase [Aureibacter tunicatorum]